MCFRMRFVLSRKDPRLREARRQHRAGSLELPARPLGDGPSEDGVPAAVGRVPVRVEGQDVLLARIRRVRERFDLALDDWRLRYSRLEERREDEGLRIDHALAVVERDLVDTDARADRQAVLGVDDGAIPLETGDGDDSDAS